MADGDLDVVVLDARERGETLRGDRSLALSHGARLMFERLGVWSPLMAAESAVTPIVDIDISQAGGFGMTRLRAADHGLPALGYVVSYRALQCALDMALARTVTVLRYGVTVASVGGTSAYAAVELQAPEADAITARLAAVADGTGAAVKGIVRRHHDYRQTALIAKVWRAADHDSVAYERFTPQGAMALLPEGDHYALIWTMTPERAAQLTCQADHEFLANLARTFGPRAGAFTRIEDRRAFPLVLEYGIAFTHGLVGAFGNDLPLMRWPRGLALTLLDALPPAKRAFTRTMLFGV